MKTKPPKRRADPNERRVKLNDDELAKVAAIVTRMRQDPQFVAIRGRGLNDSAAIRLGIHKLHETYVEQANG